MINLVHPSCESREGSALDWGGGTRQVRLHLAGTAGHARPAAPAASAMPCGAVVPSSCGTLVPSPLNVYLSIKLQHNSWNFISIKNVHETCCILLSNPRF
jgi:hypothetical protein